MKNAVTTARLTSATTAILRSVGRTRRAFSSSSGLLVTQRQENGVVSLQLSNQPVNSLSHAVCQELSSTLSALEQDSSVRGVVIGSAVKGIFSAGLDINSMILTPENPVESLTEFWTAVQEMWLALYTTPLATVAAVSGHCPAGGCLLALSCDARVMVEGKFGLGLNEVHLGLLAPPWLSRMLVDYVGWRRAEGMLQRGELLSPTDALAVGLVDDVVPLAALHDAANAQMTQLLQVPDAARALAKHQMRREAAAALRHARSEDLDAFMALTTDPSVQASLIAYLQALKAKKDQQ